MILEEFINYVLSFYGKGGLYDIGATREEVLHATCIRLLHNENIPFHGDTIDRETVKRLISQERAAV